MAVNKFVQSMAEAKFNAMRKAGVFIAESPATLGETLLIAAGKR